MLTGQDEQTVIVKSSPELQDSFINLVREKPEARLLALDALTAWSLEKNNLSFQCLGSFSKIEGHSEIHEELERYYDQFIAEVTSAASALNLKLLKNHLCWEIQSEYFLLKEITGWVKRNGITRVIFESIEVNEQRRFAPHFNDLAQVWFKQKGVHFEILPKT